MIARVASETAARINAETRAMDAEAKLKRINASNSMPNRLGECVSLMKEFMHIPMEYAKIKAKSYRFVATENSRCGEVNASNKTFLGS